MENYARSTTLLSAEAANTFRDVHDSLNSQWIRVFARFD